LFQIEGINILSTILKSPKEKDIIDFRISPRKTTGSQRNMGTELTRKLGRGSKSLHNLEGPGPAKTPFRPATAGRLDHGYESALVGTTKEKNTKKLGWGYEN